MSKHSRESAAPERGVEVPFTKRVDIAPLARAFDAAFSE